MPENKELIDVNKVRFDSIIFAGFLRGLIVGLENPDIREMLECENEKVQKEIFLYCKDEVNDIVKEVLRGLNRDNTDNNSNSIHIFSPGALIA